MRRWNNLWALAAVALVTMLGACGGGNGATPGIGLAPLLNISGLSKTGDAYTLKFGDVAVGQKVVRKFTITNRGTTALLVKSIKDDINPFNSNLACQPGATCPDRSVAPGASIQVSIEFQPISDAAAAQKDFVIKTNDQKNASTTIKLSGQGANPDFECSTPAGVGASLDFGNMVKGTTATKKITCKNVSALDAVLQILDITGPNAESFTYSLAAQDGKILVQAGRSVEIPVTFKALATALFENFAQLNLQVEKGKFLAPVTLTGRVLERALEIDPLPKMLDETTFDAYDFGFVKPGTAGTKTIVLRNLGNAPLEVQDFSLDPTSDASFSLDPPPPFTIGGFNPDVIGANEVRATLRFAPTAVGTQSGQINIVSADPAAPVQAYKVNGFGGGPTISCTPNNLGAGGTPFETTAFGVPRTKEVVCTNTAEFDDPTTEEDRLKIFAPFMKAPVSDFRVRVKEGIRRDGYGVGDTFTLVVEYDPKNVGDQSDTVILKTNDTGNSEYQIPVKGKGINLPPCSFEVRPANGLRFGNVAPRKRETIQVAFVNTGSTACALQDIQIAPGSDPAFQLGNLEGLSVIPYLQLDAFGEQRVDVSYAPVYRNSAAEGELQYQINVPSFDKPLRTMKLTGSANPPCILVAPDEADFGAVAPQVNEKQCSTRTRTFKVINICGIAIDVTGIAMAPGPSDEFKITKSPFSLGGGPITVAADGGSIAFDMVYQPTAKGEDTGAVWVQTAQQVEPYVAVLHGRGDFEPTQTDRFSQQQRPKVDVLWVVANTGWNSAAIKNVGANAKDFWDFATSNDIDFHLAVTTTGIQYTSWNCNQGAGIAGLEDGRLVPADNARKRIITPETPNGFDIFKKNITVDACQYYEGGIHTSYKAVTDPLATQDDDPRYPEKNDGNLGFLRSDAALSIIYVTNGPSTQYGEYPTPLKTTDFYYNSILSAKNFGEAKLSIHGFINDKDPRTGNSQCPSAPGIGTRYKDMIKKGGGLQLSVCPDDWSQAMRIMASAAFGYRSCFTLTGQPNDADGNGVISDKTTPPELQVSFEHAGGATERVESLTDRGQRNWEYDPTTNQVCFFPLSSPEPGTGIVMQYGIACLQ